MNYRIRKIGLLICCIVTMICVIICNRYINKMNYEKSLDDSYIQEMYGNIMEVKRIDSINRNGSLIVNVDNCMHKFNIENYSNYNKNEEIKVYTDGDYFSLSKTNVVMHNTDTKYFYVILISSFVCIVIWIIYINIITNDKFSI